MTATVSHHSIARHYFISVSDHLPTAKRQATREFRGGFDDHKIVIKDDQGVIVASRRIGSKHWCS